MSYLISGLLLCSGLVLFFLLFRGSPFSASRHRVFLLSSVLFVSVGLARIFSYGSAEVPPGKAQRNRPERAPRTDQSERFHDLSLSDWLQRDLDEQLQLATQLLQELRQENLFVVSIRSEQEFSLWALALNRCMVDAEVSQTRFVREVALECIERDLQKYK